MQKVQTKKESIAETTTQVISDIAGNAFIAIPMAYYLHDIKTRAITEIFFVMLIYNFGKTYAIRRLYEAKLIKKTGHKIMCGFNKIKQLFWGNNSKDCKYREINKEAMG